MLHTTLKDRIILIFVFLLKNICLNKKKVQSKNRFHAIVLQYSSFSTTDLITCLLPGYRKVNCTLPRIYFQSNIHSWVYFQSNIHSWVYFQSILYSWVYFRSNLYCWFYFLYFLHDPPLMCDP